MWQIVTCLSDARTDRSQLNSLSVSYDSAPANRRADSSTAPPAPWPGHSVSACAVRAVPWSMGSAAEGGARPSRGQPGAGTHITLSERPNGDKPCRALSYNRAEDRRTSE
jgi:hypothetical protein